MDNKGPFQKSICIVSGIFDTTPGKAQIMNEMLLYAGFMNGVTSLFVPNLCSEQDNKVSGALAPPTKSTSPTAGHSLAVVLYTSN